MVQGVTRLPNWRARFAAEMDRQRREAFAWGAQDCALGLACGAVLAITGTDLGADWRGRYCAPAQALRLMRSEGYDTLGDLVAATLPEVHPAFARMGDIGLIEADGPFGAALCVMDASGVIVLTEAGHGRRAREDVMRAFRVG